MKIASLAMNPSGPLGRAFGVLMEWINTPAYRAALEILAAGANERVLEIGFGTGRFAERLLESAPGIQIAGVDPAATMVAVARSRRGTRAAETRADLRQGDASALPWPGAHFQAVVAIHSFQFWPDPRQSLGEIDRVLSPSGRILLVLRDHGKKRPMERLPNPLSRSSNEVSDTISLLAQSGFAVKQSPDVGSSHVLLATRRS